MLVLLLAAVLPASLPDNDIPSPGLAVWQGASPELFTEILLAQAADEARRAEEESLEDDMDRARRHLGPEEELKQEGEQPGAEEKVDDPGQRGRRHRHSRDDGYYDDDEEDERDRRRRIRKRRLPRYPPGYEPPLIDGHGRGHYLAWGIVDWALAGGGWLVGTIFSSMAINAWQVANTDGPISDEERYPTGSRGRRYYKRDYHDMAVATTVVAVIGLAGGSFMAWRGMTNLDNFRDLRDQQRAELEQWDEFRRHKREEERR